MGEKRKKVPVRKKHKSVEILSTASESSNSDEEGSKKESAELVQRKRNYESDTSSLINQDLCLSDTDEYEEKEGKDRGMENDFLLEVEKLKESNKDYLIPSKVGNESVDKGVIKKKDVVINISENAKKLENFSPSSTMYQESTSTIQSNLLKFVEIVDRMKKHAAVLQNNLLPENIETCTCCPMHCAQALTKATKDKRGPKKKNL